MSKPAKTYWEKLKDPRWQKKRLEIMGRDEFACCECFEETKTLNVHHKWYERGKSPWEYPDHALITLCEACHEKITLEQDVINKWLGASPDGRSFVYEMAKNQYDNLHLFLPVVGLLDAIHKSISIPKSVQEMEEACVFAANTFWGFVQDLSAFQMKLNKAVKDHPDFQPHWKRKPKEVAP